MTNKARAEPTQRAETVGAIFPACCVPVLAAWQGTGRLEGPDPQRDFTGVLVAKHPGHKGMIQLVAMDGSNALCLNVAGRCDGAPFVFNLPNELVEMCRRRPGLKMWAEGMNITVPLPAWQQPGKLMLYGGRCDPDPRGLNNLMAFVGTEKPAPENSALCLGGVEVGLNPHASFSEMPFVDVEETTNVLTEPISASAFEKIAALSEVGIGFTEAEVRQGKNFHLWQFGKSWAVTMCNVRGAC